MTTETQGAKGPEARKDVRRRTKNLVLTCYRANLPDSTKGRVNLGREILDISSGGCRVTLTEDLGLSTNVTVELRDKDTGELFLARGSVVWVQKRAPGAPAGIFQVGIRFEEIFTRLGRRERFIHGRSAGDSAVAPIQQRPPTTIQKAEARNNNRRGERFHIDDYSIHVMRPGFLSALRGKNLATEVVDISASGAQVVCIQKFELETKLLFRLTLRKFGDVLDLNAKVVWVKEGAYLIGDNLYYTGLTFMEVPPDQKRILESMVSWFTSYQARYRATQKGATRTRSPETDLRPQ